MNKTLKISLLLSIMAIFCIAPSINCMDSNTPNITEHFNEEFMEIVETGDIQQVKDLLDQGANINYQNRYGKTPLMGAIQNNRTDIALKLIQDGANINLEDCDGNTALLCACRNNCEEIILALIQGDANTIVENRFGNTPLCSALSFFTIKFFPSIALALIQNGAYMDAKLSADINTSINIITDKKVKKEIKKIQCALYLNKTADEKTQFILSDNPNMFIKQIYLAQLIAGREPIDWDNLFTHIKFNYIFLTDSYFEDAVYFAVEHNAIDMNKKDICNACENIFKNKTLYCKILDNITIEKSERLSFLKKQILGEESPVDRKSVEITLENTEPTTVRAPRSFLFQ